MHLAKRAFATQMSETRVLQFAPKYQEPRQVWLENMDTIDEQKLGILDLHPEVFADTPRTDIIAINKRWQEKYRQVNWDHTKTQAEVRGGGKKPWPQKGLGMYLDCGTLGLYTE